MTQEIGTVQAVEGPLDLLLYPIGSFLRIIPFHVSIICVSHLYTQQKNHKRINIRPQSELLSIYHPYVLLY